MKWDTSPFETFITLQRGFDLPKTEMLEGDIPVLGSNCIIGHHNAAKVNPPGVVTGRSGTLGVVQYAEEPFWPHNTALWVKDFKGNLPKFVYYKLQTLRLENFNSGASVPTLNRNVLNTLPVKLPEPKAQRIIADILSGYDDLIENNRRRIKLLEESARLLYREWFIHFRFPGHEHVKIINGIPAGWETGPLSRFCDTASGGTPSRKIPEYFTGTIPWVKTQELQNTFISETEENITEDALRNSAAKVFPIKTVLLAMYGATIGELGILGIPAATNQACCALTPKSSAGHYIYIYLWCQNNKIKLIGLAAGAAQKNISQQIIKNCPFVCPSKPILDVFSLYLEPAFEQIMILQKQSSLLIQARDILLPKLMNGEVSV